MFLKFLNPFNWNKVTDDQSQQFEHTLGPNVKYASN